MVQEGKRRYNRDVRPTVEANKANIGKMLALDADTGEYEIDSNLIEAVRRLKSRLPHARPFAIRVGFPTAARIGAGTIR